MLPSTEIQPTWVVVPDGCTVQDPSNCTQARGGTFKSDKSSNREQINTFALGAEANLGLTQNYDNGAFAYETLGVVTPGGGNVSLTHQVIAGIATKDFFVGNLGLSPLGINFTSRDDPKPSFLSSLRAQNLIPSLSYGFTAGAYYQDKANASLTLGGYDSSKFTSNGISFSFGPQSDRQLTVALNSVTSSSGGSSTDLLPNGILTLIDSTVPGIWLPAEACDLFEKTFGLIEDPIRNLYMVNDTLHDDLVKADPSITFELSNNLNSGPTVKITLPYSAFDLPVTYPLVKTPTRYFPLRRAKDETQHTLGRSFLQEAYIIVDNERGNFSVSQTTFANGPAHIMTINPPNQGDGSSGVSPVTPSQPSDASVAQPSSNNKSSHAFPVGAIAGIAIAVVLITLICGTLAICYNLKKRRRRASTAPSELAAHPQHPKDVGELEDTDQSRGFWSRHVPGLKAVKSTTSRSSGTITVKGGDEEDYTDKEKGANDTNALNLIELSNNELRQRAELPSPEPWLRPELESPDPGLLARSQNSTPVMGFRAEPSPLPSPEIHNDSAFGSPAWMPIQSNAGLPSPVSSRPGLIHGRQGSQESALSDIISPITSPNLGSSPFTAPPHPPPTAATAAYQHNRRPSADSNTLPTMAAMSMSSTSTSSSYHPHHPHQQQPPLPAISPPTSPVRPPYIRNSTAESQDSGVSDPSTVTISPILKPTSRTSTGSSSLLPTVSSLAHDSQLNNTGAGSIHRRPTLRSNHSYSIDSGRQDSFETRISEATAAAAAIVPNSARRESFQSWGKAREVEIVRPPTTTGTNTDLADGESGRTTPISPPVRDGWGASARSGGTSNGQGHKRSGTADSASGLLSLQEGKEDDVESGRKYD